MVLSNEPSSDEIFQLNKEFGADSRVDKVNGGIGVYLDDIGKPYVLPVVKKAIKSLKFDNFNYLPIAGDQVYLDESAKLVFGEQFVSGHNECIAKQASVGGTNGLYIWGSVIRNLESSPSIIISNPTWENHKKIFTNLGFSIFTYEQVGRNNKFNYEGFKKTLLQHPKAYVLLQGGFTHNPTGVNPDNNQWVQLATVVKETGHKVVFDYAYMGLGEDVPTDSFSVRSFVKNDIPVSVVISYSKNMSLYQHRVGAIFTICSSKEEKLGFEKHLTYMFRIINSNPPAFGEQIVKTILNSTFLKNEWIHTLKDMVNRLDYRRQLFAKHAGKNFGHVVKEKGLFSILDLRKDQIDMLRKKKGIYLLSSGRINFGGIPVESISRVATTISKLS